MGDWTPDLLASPLKALVFSLLDLFTQMFEVLTGWLPNPDPFRTSTGEVSSHISDSYTVQLVAYWLDTVFDMEAIITIAAAMFEMFALGWLILMLWKWVKLR